MGARDQGNAARASQHTIPITDANASDLACVYWDEAQDGWSSEGVTTATNDDGSVMHHYSPLTFCCDRKGRCDHLGVQQCCRYFLSERPAVPTALAVQAPALFSGSRFWLGLACS